MYVLDGPPFVIVLVIALAIVAVIAIILIPVLAIIIMSYEKTVANISIISIAMVVEMQTLVVRMTVVDSFCRLAEQPG